MTIVSHQQQAFDILDEKFYFWFSHKKKLGQRPSKLYTGFSLVYKQKIQLSFLN